MTANRYSRQYDGIGTNPYVFFDDYGFRRDALFVDTLCRVGVVVVQRCDGYALSQVYVITDADRSYDGAVQPYAGVVANDDIAHGIVDAAVRLHHAASS